MNNFFDQGNFGAMKTLSGWEAARCDEHQFRAKIEPFWSYRCFKVARSSLGEGYQKRKPGVQS